MNKQYAKDIAKHVNKTPLNQELSPGSTPRRYEPKGGVAKHNARIHKESKEMDGKNLDFTFSKPWKPKGPSAVVACDNCGYQLSGTKVTVGVICPECKQFSTVSEVDG